MHESKSRRPSRRRVLGAIAAGSVGATLAGCLGEDDYEDGEIETVGSVEQLAVLDREPEIEVTLLDDNDEAIDSGTTDSEGAYLFRELEPGTYSVRDEDARVIGESVTVLAPDEHPEQDHYDDQTLEPGVGYIEARDGITLSCQVVLPDAAEWGDGPYPVVVDYSGYEPSHSFYDGVDDRFTARGYAVVGVNMRGTGCSGGAFDYFERLQALDGYDAVETIAAQDWADGVGLVGKSYPGISQLFVAAEQPPSLDAIVPGHVVCDFYRGVVYPGGIRNEGFAEDWAISQELRIDNTIHQWVPERIDDGDEECEQNQRLRGQSPPLIDRIEDNEYDDGIWSERRPWDLADQIAAPTLLVNAWQDEQTGGRPANLLPLFDDDTPVRFVGCNGDHDEYYGPEVFADIERFLAYYLREEVPDTDDGESFEAAREAYEAESPYRVYWEVGAGDEHDRAPTGVFDFDAWPPTAATRSSFHLHENGELRREEPPATAGETTYQHEPTGRLGSGNIDEWDIPAAKTAATFVSSPLEQETPVLGPIAAELWIGADADDVDVCVMVSEVRPDGTEVYVQPGWLRASHRREDETEATELVPWHHHTTDETTQLEGIERMRVECYPVGHIFHEGSRVKLTVQAPGGNRSLWKFDALEAADTVTVAHGPDRPAALHLPVLEDVPVPATPPPCGELRMQPCREHPDD